jgi:hypothetical protein
VTSSSSIAHEYASLDYSSYLLAFFFFVLFPLPNLVSFRKFIGLGTKLLPRLIPFVLE